MLDTLQVLLTETKEKYKSLNWKRLELAQGDPAEYPQKLQGIYEEQVYLDGYLQSLQDIINSL